MPDPKTLQQTWLMPGGGRGGRARRRQLRLTVTVTVTLPDGTKVEGRLVRIDDFLVTLPRCRRASALSAERATVRKVEIHDPLQPHKELLPEYTDKDIHDLTAYLVTLK